MFTKAELDDLNMLTRAIAEDAIEDDASAHTVEVLTEVSEASQAQPSRPRPADLEATESGKAKPPRAIRRDSSLTIPSPTARDAEVMQSNEAWYFFADVFALMSDEKRGKSWHPFQNIELKWLTSRHTCRTLKVSCRQVQLEDDLIVEPWVQFEVTTLANADGMILNKMM